MKTLHADIRSHFSLGESVLSLGEIETGVSTGEWSSAILADTMSINGMPDFTRKMQKIGVKPIVGCRLRVVDSLDRNKRAPTCFPKLICRTARGLVMLQKLLTLANDDDHFYYVPRLTWGDILDTLSDAKDDFYLTSGTLYSAIRQKSGVVALESAASILGLSHVFLEVCPVDSPLWDRQCVNAVHLADKLGLETLVSKPALHSEDMSRALQIMNGIAANRKLLDEDFTAHVKDYGVDSSKDVIKSCANQVARIRSSIDPSFASKAHLAGVRNWEKIENGVSFVWSKMPISLPVMALDENAALVDLVKAGFKARMTQTVFGNKISNPKPYVDRLKMELGVLTDMGFAGYFLLVADIVQWSKSSGILVGPGRGSVGGSLVAFCIGITDVDPLRFDLIFERFINPDRLDLPDVDLDFASSRRHEVLSYIETKFGSENVAGISNYTTLGSAAALRDVGRIMGMSLLDIAISKAIPKEHNQNVSLERALNEEPRIRFFADKNPEIFSLAVQLEDKVRSMGRHAAGVVVSGCPLVERAVVERRGGAPTVNWDKQVVEDMGLVKIDVLGLSNLDLIRIAKSLIFERHGVVIDETAIPLDDQNTLDALASALTIGIFQFEKSGARRLLREVGKSGDMSFNDIVALSALNRPGPLDAGLTDDYISIRQGFMAPHYVHPMLRPALEETDSVIVYQEQVMRISRDLCGFTMAEADALRKAVGKKDPIAMAKYRDRFVSGAVVGYVQVKLANGSSHKVHKERRFKVAGELLTVQEISDRGLDFEESWLL